MIVDHNPTWPSAKIIARIKWMTKHRGTGKQGFTAWFKWLIGMHRIGWYDHMPPAYRHRLPELEARYQEWVAKLKG
jgi:hypothetical protein